MAYQLMGAGAADSFEAKCERCVLKNRKMAKFEDLLQEPVRLFRWLVEQLIDRSIGIAEPRCCCNNLFGIGGVRQKFDEHGHCFRLRTAPSGKPGRVPERDAENITLS